MPYQLITTVVVIGFMIGIPLVWDIVVVTAGQETISEQFRNMGHEWSALLIYGVSVLPGHWWVNFETSLADYIGANPVFELFFVLWIGWTIHWLSVTQEWQLTPVQALLLIYFSVLVGAFGWTMSPVH